MKKIFIPIVFLISLTIILFVVFTNANTNLIEEQAALKIGEEKYLKFLWMIDGAFNNEKLKEEFTVNDKKLPPEDKIFTCEYKNKKSNECTGKNFEIEFNNLFSKNINYEKVYSDGITYSWMNLTNGKYVFNVLNSCNLNRMGINHKIMVTNIEKDHLTYQVVFNNRQTNQDIQRNFELVLENNKWKIDYAFYYDLCGMWYTIH